jgi:hypothetical protein
LSQNGARRNDVFNGFPFSSANPTFDLLLLLYYFLFCNLYFYNIQEGPASPASIEKPPLVGGYVVSDDKRQTKDIVTETQRIACNSFHMAVFLTK